MSADDIARGAPRPKAVLSDELKARIAERVKGWGVRAERAVATETSALVFGTRAGRPVVVKIARARGDEWRSGEITAAFGGRGVVQVHDQVGGAVLLERIVPGTPLVTLVLDGRDDEATEILAALLRRMSPGEPPAGCATVETWGLGFERYLATNDARISRELVLHAQRVYSELAAAQREPALLHGDLQHSNVLRDEGRGWVAIDPKGVIGELEYEIGAALRNPYERPDLVASTRDDRAAARDLLRRARYRRRSRARLGVRAGRALGDLERRGRSRGRREQCGVAARARDRAVERVPRGLRRMIPLGGLLTMRGRPIFASGLALPFFAGWVGACLAQPAPPTCALTDRACVDENYSSVCFEKGATPESCGAWLRPFELSPSLDVRNSVAGTYLLVADHWQPRDPQPWLKDRAAALIHGILEQDPANAEALLGLASFAQTNDEYVAALRRVVAVDPSPGILGFLRARCRGRRAISPNPPPSSNAPMRRRCSEQPGPYAWRFARDAVFEYESTGLPSRAAQLRRRFEHDVDLDGKVAETTHAEAVEPARLNSALGEICAEIILRVLGATHCLAGIEQVVDAADRASVDSLKARLAKSASDAMFLAAQTGGDVLTLADPAWRDRFVSTLQRYFGSDSADRMRHTLTEITVE